jgi:hypothetical protein
MKLQFRYLAALLFLTMVIAYLLLDVVEQLVIRPIIYLFWVLGVVYSYVPQPVLWLVVVMVLIYLALSNLLGKIDFADSDPRQPRRTLGPVAELAMQIERKDGGIYFKWQIARTLGRIAIDLQDLRQHNHSRILDFNPETITPRVQRYLDAGLNTSFSDYPIPGRIPWIIKNLFSRKNNQPVNSVSGSSPTPFDGDINPVIAYLESEMEKDNDIRRS